MWEMYLRQGEQTVWNSFTLCLLYSSRPSVKCAQKKTGTKYLLTSLPGWHQSVWRKKKLRIIFLVFGGMDPVGLLIDLCLSVRYWLCWTTGQAVFKSPTLFVFQCIHTHMWKKMSRCRNKTVIFQPVKASFFVYALVRGLRWLKISQASSATAGSY